MDDKAAEVQSLIRTIQIPAISKAALQSICAVNGIPKTGNKSDLQRRIIKCKSGFCAFLALCVFSRLFYSGDPSFIHIVVVALPDCLRFLRTESSSWLTSAR